MEILASDVTTYRAVAEKKKSSR